MGQPWAQNSCRTIPWQVWWLSPVSVVSCGQIDTHTHTLWHTHTQMNALLPRLYSAWAINKQKRNMQYSLQYFIINPRTNNKRFLIQLLKFSFLRYPNREENDYTVVVNTSARFSNSLLDTPWSVHCDLPTCSSAIAAAWRCRDPASIYWIIGQMMRLVSNKRLKSVRSHAITQEWRHTYRM